MMKPMILVVLLLDVSGSMAMGSRIEALNSNVRTLLGLMRSGAPEAANPMPFWTKIAAFTDASMWIVEEPTPADEVQWADLYPWSGQRADIARAIAEAENVIAAEVPGRFDSALLVVVSDAAAMASVPPGNSGTERVTLLVDAAGTDPRDSGSAETVLRLAQSLLG